jgi:branched-chain amino acid transport system ATP-binding protein
MLEIDGLRVRYGSMEALRGASLSVREGEVVGLVGHNGVGKSTTLKAVAGIVRASGGSIAWCGSPLESGSAVRAGIGYVPEDRRIFSALSVLENLRIGATVRRDRAQIAADIERELDRFPILRERLHQRAGDLSGGQQQMLAVARALVSRPRLLLLDEPTLGLAPIIVDQLFGIVTRLRDEGVTVLLVEQNVAKTVKVADRVYVMAPGGRIEREGTGAELAADPEFHRHYLRLPTEKGAMAS